MVLEIGGQDGSRPKCFFTSSQLPSFVDHNQPPLKKRPFVTLAEQPLSHTMSVVMPEENGRSLQASLLEHGRGTLHYARVHMKLSDVIEEEFLNTYIKTGNIAMLSEGRSGVDHIFSLQDGILRLEVDKPTFERVGLEGKVIPSEGRKHVKARYAIELNLRLPSMVKGKKGFERIVWAFHNVLNHSVAWLFHDFNQAERNTSPIARHCPLERNVSPSVQRLAHVSVPEFPDDIPSDGYEDATDLLEWLSLALQVSPRLQSTDDMDPYLCRYHGGRALVGTKTQSLTHLSWHGFIPTSFATKILLATMKASGDGWFGLSAASFSGQAYITLQSGEYSMSWSYLD